MLATEMKKDSKVRSILISQPKPEGDKSPYFNLAKKYRVKIDFRPFIFVEGIPSKEFRKSRVNIQEHTAVILTSRNAIDHFFRTCDELRIKMSQETKFLCISEAVALYLQKYTMYRKRKVFFGDGTSKGLTDILMKYKNGEKLLFPCSDIHKKDIPDFLVENGFDFSEAVIYKTVLSDLSDLKEINYDMIVFFSPSGVKSLFHNFPKFKQSTTRIAAFGPTTSQAVLDANLRLDVRAPIPQALSMTMALERYLKKNNK
ncbi:MAG: uroporphyrinogen-III synthase [Bacteroidetes bacterium]|nr:uroporphyrinogen-III synthase [Bacteroidota bacterium]